MEMIYIYFHKLLRPLLLCIRWPIRTICFKFYLILFVMKLCLVWLLSQIAKVTSLLKQPFWMKTKIIYSSCSHVVHCASLTLPEENVLYPQTGEMQYIYIIIDVNDLRYWDVVDLSRFLRDVTLQPFFISFTLTAFKGH